MKQILINYFIFNTTNIHIELKSGRVKDQVGLFIQYYNINFLFNSCKGIFYSPLSVELINPIKRLNNNQNKDKKITNALDSIQPDT